MALHSCVPQHLVPVVLQTIQAHVLGGALTNGSIALAGDWAQSQVGAGEQGQGGSHGVAPITHREHSRPELQ